MSLSRVVEYLCLAFPVPSRIDHSTPNHSSDGAGTQAQTSLQSDWRAEKSWGSGQTREPVTTTLSRLLVDITCVLGFCLHGLISVASIVCQVASSRFALLNF